MTTFDFEQEEQIESALAVAVKAYTPPAGLREAIRERLFSETHGMASSPRPRPARSKLRKVLAAAIAASLLVAAAVWLNWPGTNLTSVAFAEFQAVVENSEQPQWVHFLEGDREIWMSFQPSRCYDKSRHVIFGADYGTNRLYRYDMAKNTLTVSCPGPESNPCGSYAEFILDQIKHLEQNGMEVGKGTETLDGKTITVYVVTGFKEGRRDTLKYLFDPQSNRVLGMEGVAFGGLFKIRMLIEYLKEGPADVYAIGVPKDAKVIDETPGPDVMALYEKVESAATAARQSRYEVSVEMPESFSEPIQPSFAVTMTVSYDQDRTGISRSEGYYVRWPAGLSHENALLHLENLRKEFPVDRLDQLEAWRSKRKPDKILIWDDRRRKATAFQSNQGKLNLQTFTAPPRADVVRVVRLDGKPALIQEQGKWGKLIGIENHPTEYQRVRSYFNPDRDYVCERREFRVSGVPDSPPHSDSSEVVEYAKTLEGRWYAHKTRKVDCSERETLLVVSFQDDSRDIAPALFDASKVTSQDLAEPSELATGK